MFSGMSAEISDSIATTVEDEADNSGIVLVSAKPRSDAGKHYTLQAQKVNAALE